MKPASENTRAVPARSAMQDVMPAADTITVGLVACGKTKTPTPSPARALYTGELFRRVSAFAEQTCDAWFILSAKHYLVHPDEILEPYDRTLAEMSAADRRHWGWTVESDIRLGFGKNAVGREWPPAHPRLLLGRWIDDGRKRGVERTVDLYFHAGAAYVDPIANRLRGSRWARVHAPLAGLGIGERLAWYDAHRSSPGAA